MVGIPTDSFCKKNMNIINFCCSVLAKFIMTDRMLITWERERESCINWRLCWFEFMTVIYTRLIWWKKYFGHIGNFGLQVVVVDNSNEIIFKGMLS